MRYDALTRAIYLQYRSLFDRTPAAVLALVLVALTALVLAARGAAGGAGALAPHAPGAARPRAPAPRSDAGAGPRSRTAAPSSARSSRVPGCGARLLARARRSTAPSLPWREAAQLAVRLALAARRGRRRGLPIAVLAVRYPRALDALLERLAYAGERAARDRDRALARLLRSRLREPLYQTLALLVFAYVVRFLPQALAGVESALAAVDPRLEEAARGARARRRVAALADGHACRSSAPGILAGAALVFLSAMKELPATLLLRPIGFETLATEIWSFTSVGAYSRAALPALVLIAVSAPFVYYLSSRHEPGEVEHG